MTTFLPIYHSDDLYEVRLSHGRILSIRRFTESDNAGTEIPFDNLPFAVQERILANAQTIDPSETGS